MTKLSRALVQSIRPVQWLTNLLVFAPLFFADKLFDLTLLLRAVGGFLLLCGLSGVTFLVNDVIDRERDQTHPVRRHRPVATGALSVPQALWAAAILGGGCSTVALLWQPAFGLAAVSYLLLMLAYSSYLRNLPVFDVLAIAGGLVLRAVSGALLIQAVVSPWFYLSVGGLGLILGLGRVQYEMRLAHESGALNSEKYTLELVERMNRLASAMTLVVYCLYTFLAHGPVQGYGMMLTIPFAIYGIFRYRYLTYQPTGRSPGQLMVADRPLRITGILWVITAALLLYWR